jgi:hypothetical protein
MLPAGDDDRLSGKAGRARLVALQHALMKLINRSTLRKRDLIKAAFNDFSVLSPPQAISIAERAIRRWQAHD